MNRSEYNFKDFIFMLFIILIIILISSVIFLFWRILFFIIVIIIIVSDLFSNFPAIGAIPFIGQIILSLFQGISNITVGHKINIYIGFGITLFLHFGLNINFIKLLIELV